MLLFVIGVFFHYDLLHCDNDNDNFKDGFLDYSITQFWWNGTPGIDQTDRITPQYSFMPTPYGHGKFVGNDGEVYDDRPYSPLEPTAHPNKEKTFTPFPNITRASYPFPVDKHTVVRPSLPPSPLPLPSPWHINYPGLTPPPNFPSDYRYPTVFPQHEPLTEYSPSPTGPTPRRPSFTLPSVSRPKLSYPTLFATSMMFPSVDELEGSRATTTPEPDTSPASMDLNAFVKLWKAKRASEAALGAVTTPLNKVPKLRGIFNYDYTTEETPLALRRVPSMGHREFRKNQKVTMNATLALRDPGREDTAASHGPDNLAEKAMKHTQSLTTATRASQGTGAVSESISTTNTEDTEGGDGVSKTNRDA